MGTNIDLLNSESLAFLDSSHFKTTEWRKARMSGFGITGLALLDQTTNSSSCLPSLVNVTPRYLNFSTCFNDTQPTCKEHCPGFLERGSTSVLEVLIFIRAMSHAAAKPFDECWRPDSEKSSKTKSSTKSNGLIFHLPIVTHYNRFG